MPIRATGLRTWLALLMLVGVVALGACGEAADGGGPADEAGARSIVTGREQLTHQIITEADAGTLVETPWFCFDLGLPDRKGMELHLTGDDASTLRWRFAQKPDPLFLEWAKVDGGPPFETDGLIGDPTEAAKVLEFRGSGFGRTSLVVELVERDPAARTGAPAQRLEFPVEVAGRKPGAGGAIPC